MHGPNEALGMDPTHPLCYESSPRARQQRPLTESELDDLFSGRVDQVTEALPVRETHYDATKRAGYQCLATETGFEASVDGLIEELEAQGVQILELLDSTTDRARTERPPTPPEFQWDQTTYQSQRTETFVNTWLHEQPPPDQQVREPRITSVHPGYVYNLLDALKAANQNYGDLQTSHNAVIASNHKLSQIIKNIQASNHELTVLANKHAPVLANKDLQIYNQARTIKELQDRNQELAMLANNHNPTQMNKDLQLVNQMLVNRNDALNAQNARVISKKQTLEKDNFNLLDSIKQKKGDHAEMTFFLEQEHDYHVGEIAMMKAFHRVEVEEVRRKAFDEFMRYIREGTLSAGLEDGFGDVSVPFEEEVRGGTMSARFGVGFGEAGVPIKEEERDGEI
jgi:hypothetical protein